MPDVDINFLLKSTDLCSLLPKNMETAALRNIARKLARWKRRELTDDEKLEIEDFALSWSDGVLKLQNSPLVAKFQSVDYAYSQVVLAMAELEYLVHNEIVSREIQCITYEPENAFELKRLRHLSPDFLRVRLYLDGYGAIADGDLSCVMSSISKFLEE